MVVALLKAIVTMDIFKSVLKDSSLPDLYLSVVIGNSDLVSMDAFDRKVFMVSIQLKSG
jgi:hypothetical protein